ncbi:MAG: 50S ribosomal protein L24 [Magnetococcales bacterium]|nr:50S ribosomal protein L24 [Magnetococcales bacterium]MBF0582806.1 50S ribosomal protein L24 [Magnetococcales bacterium]
MKDQIKTNLKKGDQVVVITGKDRGKKGRILQVLPKEGAVLVERVNMVKRHTKPQKGNEGGIVEKEAPIDISNVMYLDVASGKGVRLGKKFLEDGRKVRVMCGSGEVIDR